MNVLIIGATGIIGRTLIPQLLNAGHHVTALIRKESDARYFTHLNISCVLGDIFDKQSLLQASKACDSVIHLATAIPNWELTARIRTEGTKNLLEACQQNGINKYLQQSISFLYGSSDALLTEQSPLQPFELINSCMEMEKLVQESSLNWTILRAGLLYGEGTFTEYTWLQQAHNQTLHFANNGKAYTSFIHVQDLAQAFVKALNALKGTIYNVVDNKPLQDKELFDYINGIINQKESITGGERFLPSQRCSNKLLKQELSWEPYYPTLFHALTPK